MPELRKDPVAGNWVIIATERNTRPRDLAIARKPIKTSFCPFCRGNESATPPPVLVNPASGDWRVRVVPNKFPALKIEGALESRGIGLYDQMAGIGAHEVIIETPDHDKRLADLDDQGVRDVLLTYQQRILDLGNDHRFKYVLVFKNHGRDAGATLEHSHSQLIALPIVPVQVATEMAGAVRYFDFRHRCVYCDILAQDLGSGDRIVYEGRHTVALAPFASRFPFETWIVPRRHESSFEMAGRDLVEDCAHVVANVLRKLDVALGDPSYNFMLHTAPLHQRFVPHYHWHVEIIPTLTRVAGFEWGSGFYINPTPPERAAEFLRSVERQDR